MMKVIIIVLDGVGVGELPDAYLFGDQGSATLPNLADYLGGLFLPNLEKMGLGNIVSIKGIKAVSEPLASFGKMAERSPAKDTTVGHWELMGIIKRKPFPTYPNGFPPEIIEKFKKAIKRDILGNIPASGTEIIKQLGEEHMRTGYPIVYTSADSVFQIAAHEDVIPLLELYDMCQKARRILRGRHAVGRVIARPFAGNPGSFYRTAGRKDFSLPPPRKTVLDYAKQYGYETIAVGKVKDIFAGRGFTQHIPAFSNKEIMDGMLRAVEGDWKGILLANLVDFDMVYGHRNDPVGFANALKEFDDFLPHLLEAIADNVLFITADHGCDPTTPSTDHSREFVPILFYQKGRKPVQLGTRKTFADLAATISKLLGLNYPTRGVPFY
ncbi:phosphopentomutase [bacterium]|nr:phosphopentomutase [bacterium]